MRIWLFRLILLAIPLLFFVLLELGLRIGGFGYSYPLFITDPSQPGFYLVNPQVIKRYFAKPEMAPSVKIESTYFTQQKRPDVLRVVVQGGSTAAGYPYGLGASLAGMLQQRLQHQFPDRYVEVIQTAMAAVNSYTLLDFSDEILKIQPDAVVIYAGHNEYVGVMGVGSAFANHNRALTLLMLKLKDLRLYQAIQRLYVSVIASPDATAPKGNRTLMARVARDKNIEFGSTLYQQGLDQFKGNMELLLSRYHKAGIPVYISTVASNLRDHPPFNSPNDDANLQAVLDQITNQLKTPLTPDNAQTAIQTLTAASANKCNALAAYRLGQLSDVVGDYAQAKTWYSHARDWDQLRFRAPSEINTIIHELATEYDAFLVDGEQSLIEHSPQGIIGKELMLEHLHPNVEGYFWLADSYFKSMLNHSNLEPKQSRVDAVVARQQIPVLPAEDYTARASIEKLLADYPFSATPRPVRQIPVTNWHDQLGKDMLDGHLNWLQMVQKTLNGYQQENNIAGVATAALLMTEAMPNNVKINYYAGTVLIQVQRLGEAMRVLQRVVRLEPKNTNAYLALAHARILSGNVAEGRRLLDQVLLLDPKNPTALSVKQQLAAQKKQ